MRSFQVRFLLFIYCITYFFLFFSSLSFAEKLYVKSSKTKLRFSESVKAPLLKILAKGTLVTVIIKSNRFYKVGLETGEKGWVFKFKLAKSILTEGDEELGVNDRMTSNQINANESVLVSSTVLLSPISENYAKNKGISIQNIQAVNDMGIYKINFAELDEFLREGQLGKYGP